MFGFELAGFQSGIACFGYPQEHYLRQVVFLPRGAFL
jgi:hypothetical protein